MNQLKVYGASWCGDTRRTRKLLDALGIDYVYIDIDEDPQAEAWITKQHNGKRVTPTIDLGGELFFEPSDDEMKSALQTAGML